MIVGLITPNEGSFTWMMDITREPVYKRAQRGIGYLAQEASVFRKLSVEDNIVQCLRCQDIPKPNKRSGWRYFLRNLVFSISGKALGSNFPVEKGGGPKLPGLWRLNLNFILLDEPFAGVDPIAVEDIQQIVSQLKEKNIGILITDHNVHETLSITDRAYLLFEGKILKAGNAEELAEDEQVRKLYLGEKFSLIR
jgi:lipopolysaccharide export system ATP-binding protein